MQVTSILANLPLPQGFAAAFFPSPEKTPQIPPPTGQDLAVDTGSHPFWLADAWTNDRKYDLKSSLSPAFEWGKMRVELFEGYNFLTLTKQPSSAIKR
jgi:hypothetical protein